MANGSKFIMCKTVHLFSGTTCTIERTNTTVGCKLVEMSFFAVAHPDSSFSSYKPPSCLSPPYKQVLGSS